MEIDVYVDQDFRLTEVKGMDPYEFLSDALPAMDSGIMLKSLFKHNCLYQEDSTLHV